MPRYKFSIALALLGTALVAVAVFFLIWRNEPAAENKYDPLIAREARVQGLDPFLVRALIWRESRFEPFTYGLAQEHGLMQVTPDAGFAWAKANRISPYETSDLFDPETNLRVGTWYLGRAIRHWSQTDDPETFGLAEYNAGRRNALKWVDPADPLNHVAFLQRMTFPSTRRYVEAILAKRELYRARLSNNQWYRDPALSPLKLRPDRHESSINPGAGAGPRFTGSVGVPSRSGD